MATDVFILNPRYRGYPDSDHPQYHSLSLESVVNLDNEAQWQNIIPFFVVSGGIFLIILFIPLLTLVANYASANEFGFLIVLGILALVGTMALWIGARGFRRANRHRYQSRERYKRLLAHSQILDGDLVTMICREVAAGRGTYYETSVAYQFMNPDGKRLTGIQYRNARLTPLPSGTPIRVLYADDDAYVML